MPRRSGRRSRWRRSRRSRHRHKWTCQYLNPVAESLTWLSLRGGRAAAENLLQLVDETTRLPIPDVIDR